MKRYVIVLIVLIALVVAYELVALAGHYPTITATVANLPLAAVLLIALGLGVLAVHFVRAYDRRRRP